ncbi:FRG domain-containing protein [Leucobacter celer]|uniref:FRG domain-containing protein n=1 Tax=Leucobacter celer TaxID=668625 RepID=UPI0009499B1C|nr:FRG domain-containing protein [Leucobacter celer]
MDAEEFFSPWEHTVTGWDETLTEIGNLQSLTTPSRELAWRGVANSSHALHSSVYRRFIARMGAPPDENDVVEFERALLTEARRRWRFDNLSALEILAHVQHYGGPTRLLDVSFNPLVALWFAVEKKFDTKGDPRPDTDGRLFIFDATDRQINLDAKWGGYELPWETAPTDNWRRGLPLVWRPPSYNDRIPAQNSAFLLGGVPQVYAGQNAKYRKAPGDGSSAGLWNIEEVRRATSVTLSMNSLDRAPRKDAKPTYTLRIAASGKPDIRAALENHYGFNAASIYPDLYGLAKYAADGIAI